MTNHNTPAVDTSRDEVTRLADNLPETQWGAPRLWRAADTLRALLARAEAAEAEVARLRDALENVIGNIDTPIARRRLGVPFDHPEWLVNARAALRKGGAA